MGLLDNLGGLAGLGGLGSGAGNPRAALIQAVLGMLVQGNQPGGLGGSGGMGGLAGLLQRFQNAGLGHAAASWVGTGSNLPLSSNDVRSALGDGPLRHLAEHAGLDEDQAASELSGVLPRMVDRLTPNGALPEEGHLDPGNLGDVFSQLSDLFGSKTGARDSVSRQANE